MVPPGRAFGLHRSLVCTPRIKATCAHMRRGDPFLPERISLAPEMTCLAAQRSSLAPEMTSLASQRTSLVLQMTSLVPKMTCLAPEMTCLTSQRTSLVLEMTSLAPERTSLVLERNCLAPERICLVPERKDVLPERGGRIAVGNYLQPARQYRILARARPESQACTLTSVVRSSRNGESACRIHAVAPGGVIREVNLVPTFVYRSTCAYF